jgi:hypothetical protein
MQPRRFHLAAVISAGILALLLAGCATPQESFSSLAIAPQPTLPLTADTLQPGLAVLYFKHPFVRHLDNLPPAEIARDKGWRGSPIPYLNHQFGRNEILDSGTNRGIAMQIDGYIRLERAGTYGFQANTNDGFRLFIDGHLLIDDPSWHSDRLSPVSTVVVTDPGWYTLQAVYFQRKGTASLQLYWQPPGDQTFSIVPARVLAHRTGG